MSGETARHILTRSYAREGALIAGLLSGQTLTDAAKGTGISRKTAWRLKQSEEFQRRFREAKDELLSCAIARLHRESLGFIATLSGISSDETAQPSARVQAAREGLFALYRGIEIFGLTARISRLEAMATEGK
jgi:hypothetical protein